MPRTQSTQDIFCQQSLAATGEPPPSGGRQDKRATQRARVASPRPASLNNDARAHWMNTKSYRLQKRSAKRQTVSLTLWVKPVLKAELQRLSTTEGISLSKTGATFLEEAIRQKLHVQHAVLLQPIIEQAIRREMRAFSNRLAFLLVRASFTSEQTRSIVTNILGRQQGITPNILNTILDQSSKTAKRNLTRKTPQLETIISELEQALGEAANAV